MTLVALLGAALLLPAVFLIAAYFISFARKIDDHEIKARRRWRMVNRTNIVWALSVVFGLILVADIVPGVIAPVFKVLASWLFIILSFFPFTVALGVVDRRTRGIDYPLAGYLRFQFSFFISRFLSFFLIVGLLYCPFRFTTPEGGISYAGIGIVIAGVVSFIIVSLYQMRLVGRATGMLRPLDLSQAPVRTIVELAGKAGLPNVRLFMMETFGYPFYNAFAAPGRTIYLTEPLMKTLTDEEISAVAAHEIGHLVTMKKRTALMLSLLTLGVVMLWFVVPRFAGILADINAFIFQIVAFLVILAVLVILFGRISRRFEREADRASARLSDGPDHLISALERIYQLNMLPRRFDKKGSENASHPSLERRVAELKGEELPRPKRLTGRRVILWLFIVVLLVLILQLHPWRRDGGGYQFVWVDVASALEGRLAIDPSNFEARKRLAVEYWLMEDDDKALAEIGRALALSRDPGLLILLGFIKDYDGDVRGALAAMEEAFKTGGSTVAAKWAAILAADLGERAAVDRYVEYIAQESPGDPFIGEMKNYLEGSSKDFTFSWYAVAFQGKR